MHGGNNRKSHESWMDCIRYDWNETTFADDRRRDQKYALISARTAVDLRSAVASAISLISQLIYLRRFDISMWTSPITSNIVAISITPILISSIWHISAISVDCELHTFNSAIVSFFCARRVVSKCNSIDTDDKINAQMRIYECTKRKLKCDIFKTIQCMLCRRAYTATMPQPSRIEYLYWLDRIEWVRGRLTETDRGAVHVNEWPMLVRLKLNKRRCRAATATVVVVDSTEQTLWVDRGETLTARSKNNTKIE